MNAAHYIFLAMWVSLCSLTSVDPPDTVAQHVGTENGIRTIYRDDNRSVAARLVDERPSAGWHCQVLKRDSLMWSFNVPWCPERVCLGQGEELIGYAMEEDHPSRDPAGKSRRLVIFAADPTHSPRVIESHLLSPLGYGATPVLPPFPDVVEMWSRIGVREAMFIVRTAPASRYEAWVFDLNDYKCVTKVQISPPIDEKHIVVPIGWAEMVGVDALCIHEAIVSSNEKGAVHASARFRIVGFDGKSIWSRDEDEAYTLIWNGNDRSSHIEQLRARLASNWHGVVISPYLCERSSDRLVVQLAYNEDTHAVQVKEDVVKCGPVVRPASAKGSRSTAGGSTIVPSPSGAATEGDMGKRERSSPP